MRIYYNDKDFMAMREGSFDDLKGALWIDIENPDQDLIDEINRRFDLGIPDMDILEGEDGIPRFAVDRDLHIFSPKLLTKSEHGKFAVADVVFVLAKDVCISFRQLQPECFTNFDRQVALKNVRAAESAPEVFFSLMQQLSLDYNAKIEDMSEMLSQVSHEVFTEDLDGQNGKLHKDQINRISRVENLNSAIMSSLMGLSLLGDYLQNLPGEDSYQKLRGRYISNIETLIQNGQFISDRIDFVLNAVMSVINLEQNRVVNVFSVFTVIFTLPTLMAGIWGMNFVMMPELQWKWGYALGLTVIVLSGVIPYKFVRRMGWL